MAAHCVLEAICDRVAEQHRNISEQHARWVDETTGVIMNSLTEENEALRAEVAGLRDFIVSATSARERPAVPQLPAEWALAKVAPLSVAAPPRKAFAAIQHPSGELAEPVADRTPGERRGLRAAAAFADTEPTPPSATMDARAPSKLWASESSQGVHIPGMVSASSWLQALGRSRPHPRATTARLMSGDLDAKFESRERRRLRKMFGLCETDEVVPFDDVAEVVGRRLGSRTLTGATVAEMFQEADEVREAVAGKHPELGETWLVPPGCTLDALIHLIGPEADALLQEMRPGKGFMDVVRALQITTADELVEEVAKGIVKIAPPENLGDNHRIKTTLERYMNALVVFVVVVNVCALGISLDYSPEHLGWLVFEFFCVVVFVAEAIVKICVHKVSGYFCGKARYWNIVDASITILSVLDLGISIMGVAGKTGGDETMVGKLARPVVIIRTLRVVRVIRLAKLLHSPLLRDFANMLVGFVIGAPALLWVLCLFVAVLYILGLASRLMLGPADGQDLIFQGGCGYGDDIMNFDDDRCKLHDLYGEEFFGSVSKSMFTVFRFMLGDYSTRGGKSMIVAFSYGYGAVFETFFVGFMIIVIFGLFNIITAIFVDTTTSGLKHNDIMRKYEQQYEREFVKSKLRRMVQRVQEIRMDRALDPKVIEESEDLRSYQLGEEEFVNVLMDTEIQTLMVDLDVSIFNPAGMFDTFDVDSNGHVSMLEFVQVFMKLRGDPQKTDIIGCVVSIRNLQDRVDQLALEVKRLNPQRITRRTATFAGSRSSTR